MDNWVNVESLQAMIEGPLRQEELNLKVSDLYGYHVWNWDLISFNLPQSIKEKIKAIPIQMYGNGRDMVMWKCSKNGEFNTNSAYRLAIQGEENDAQFSGQWVWKLDMLPKIINFIWLCLHGSILVREVLAGRGINCVKLCLICKEQDESILHLLRDCVFARDLWRKLEIPPTQVSSFTEGFETWLKTNCLSGMKHKGTTPWCTLFLFTLWSL